MPAARIHVGNDEVLLDDSSDMLSAQQPQASTSELMCGWGCHMASAEASET
jgi:hypothetical protein